MPIKPKRDKRKLPAAGGVLGVLIVLYAIFRPALSERLGIDLPRIPISQTETDDSIESQPTSPDDPAESTSSPPKIQRADRADSRVSAPAQPPPKQQSDTPRAGSSRPPPSAPAEELRYGILKPIGRDTYVSPAGLRYTPGSQEGHRLKHLERHIKDQPSRPGKHGVFEGGMEGMLALLDHAYERAGRGGHGVTTTKDQGRVVHTVDMGKRIGFVGGREGNRMHRPMARRVRIVLEGDRVITAFPL